MKINLIKLTGGMMLAAAAVFASCEKADEGGTTLGLNKDNVTVTAPAGSAEIQIISDMEWSIETTSGWFRFNVTEGRGNAYITVTYDENTDLDSREQNVTINGSEPGFQASFLMKQLGLAPVLKFGKAAETVNYGAGTMPLGLTTNITAADLDFDFDYGDGPADWISSYTFGDQKLNIVYPENDSKTKDRSVVITLTYTGPHAEDLSTEMTFTQRANAAQPITIAAAKALAAGAITQNVYVEGVVIAVGHGITTSGNDKMPNYNYKKNHYIIQDASGNSLVFASGTDDLDFTTEDKALTLSLNDGIKLLLSGTTMGAKSEVDGFSYPVISGITNNSILEKTAGQTVTPVEIGIADITAAHVNTLVKLKEVEVAVPFGFWNNYHRTATQLNATGKGYHAACPYSTTLIRDTKGDQMFVLTNVWMPWTYNYVSSNLALPKGSGPLTGIVVREPHERMGDIGTYQIRPRTTGDIKLAADREDGFSAVLAEWDFVRPANYLELAVLSPSGGSATTASVNKSNATGFHSGWHGAKPYWLGEIKGVETANGAIQSCSWAGIGGPVADEDKNNGESWWLIKLPTQGITSTISMQFESNSLRETGPAEMVLEYSLNNTDWVKISDYDVRGYFDWNNATDKANAGYSKRSIPGYKTYNFDLPAAVLDKEMVYIRMRARSLVSVSGGTTDQGTRNCLAHLSFKYNKQ